MDHPTVVINGVQYSTVPQVEIPKASGYGTGMAIFYDATLTDVTAGDMLNGKTAIGPSGAVTGNIPSKNAATYTPSNIAQTIGSGQYLAGTQTIEAVVCANLTAANVKSGVTVKVGTATDDKSVAMVTGQLALPSISQDSTTKVLSIS